MNRIQKTVLAVFLTLTVIEFILVYIYDTSALVRCVQFAGTVLLFVIAAIAKKEYREQRILIFGDRRFFYDIAAGNKERCRGLLFCDHAHVNKRRDDYRCPATRTSSRMID